MRNHPQVRKPNRSLKPRPSAQAVYAYISETQDRFFAGRKGQANHKYSFNPSPIVSVPANGLEAPQYPARLLP
jgi:hypothetical protein